jgi:tetratricopeptide (TPR) repeat protein
LWQELGDRWAQAHTEAVLASVLGALGDADQAKRMHAESVVAFRALDDQWMAAYTLMAFGITLRETGDWEQAERALSEGLALAQAQGDRAAVASVLGNLYYVAAARGEFETALRYAQESVKIIRETGNRYGLAATLTGLGGALMMTGEFGLARASIDEALSIAPDLALTWLPGWLYKVKARIELAAGQYQAARTAAQTAIATARKVGAQSTVAESLRLVGSAALAEGRYEEAQRSLLEATDGDATTPDNSYTPGILAALGRTEYTLGKLSMARAHLFEALETCVITSMGHPLLTVMPLIAVLLADDEDASLKERAVELYALASSQPFVSKSPFLEEIAGKYITAVETTLPPVVVEAAQARGRALDWWGTAQELLDELRSLGWGEAERP